MAEKRLQEKMIAYTKKQGEDAVRGKLAAGKTSEGSAENGRHSYVGKAGEEKDIYVSNFPSKTPKTAKRARIQELWRYKPIELNSVRNGKLEILTAPFDPTLNGRSDPSKTMFGNRKRTNGVKRVTLGLAEICTT